MNVDLDTVVQFLQEYGPEKVKTGWRESRLREYVQHYFLHEQLAVVYQADGAVVGAGFARLINKRKLTQHMKNTWRVAKEGNTIYISNLAALKPIVVVKLWDLMVKMFGRRRWIAGHRHEKFRIWTFEEYERRINKLKLYG